MSRTGVGVERVARRGVERLAEGDPFPGVRRIAVVVEGGIRATAFAAPAVAALRRAYPRAWIGLLTPPRAVPVARLLRSADLATRHEGDPASLGPALSRAEPDLVLDLTAGLRVPWIAARAGVRHRVGFTARMRGSLLDRGLDPKRLPAGLHDVDRALALAQRAGAEPAPADFDLAPGPSAKESAAQWLALQRVPEPFVLLLPGVAPGKPAWPPGHWTRLAALLRGEGIPVAIATSLAEGSVTRSLDAGPAELRGVPRFQGGLEGLAAVAGRAALAVGNGSGPVHLATALGAPSLSFHATGPETSVARTGPYGERGWGITAPPEAGTGGLDGISPAAVLSLAISILDGREPRLA